jgi:heme exporter protein CcmD
MMSFEVLRMGNYGAYVWSAYGLTLLALIAMVTVARGAARRELQAALRRVQINQSSQSNQGGARS